MAASFQSKEHEQEAEPLVRAAGLYYAFGEGDARKRVLFDVDLTVAPGEFAIMTGPSGSGKTTLLSLIGALRSPQEGELRVMGRNVGELRAGDLELFRQQIGFIFQLHNLFPALTARDSVQMALDLHDIEPGEKRKRVADILGTTAALDGDNTEIVIQRLHDLAHNKGSSILMVTQDARVFDAADRLIHLVDGRIESDTPIS